LGFLGEGASDDHHAEPATASGSKLTKAKIQNRFIEDSPLD
jgi:hypothetical protein